MRRVVVTGMGIISSIGNNLVEVTESLRNLKSGISSNEINKEMGLRSHVSGNIKDLELDKLIDRKIYRFMGDAAAYAYLSALEALENSKLPTDKISNNRNCYSQVEQY